MRSALIRLAKISPSLAATILLLSLPLFWRTQIALAHDSGETDNFTHRQENLVDMLPFLDLEMNRRLLQAQRTYELKNAGCDAEQLFLNIEEELSGWEWGEFSSTFTASTGSAPSSTGSSFSLPLAQNMHYIPAAKSYYHSALSLAPSLVVNNNYIGLDKFSEFLRHGLSQYREAYGYHRGLTGALDQAMLRESGEIKSWADLAASFGGMKFWSNLFAGDNPYFRCEGNRWHLARNFSWQDFITPAWDEAINCSEFGAETKKKITDKKLCPVDNSSCSSMRDFYGLDVSMRILHPECRKFITNQNPQPLNPSENHLAKYPLPARPAALAPRAPKRPSWADRADTLILKPSTELSPESREKLEPGSTALDSAAPSSMVSAANSNTSEAKLAYSFADVEALKAAQKLLSCQRFAKQAGFIAGVPGSSAGLAAAKKCFAPFWEKSTSPQNQNNFIAFILKQKSPLQARYCSSRELYFIPLSSAHSGSLICLMDPASEQAAEVNKGILLLRQDGKKILLHNYREPE